MNNAHRNRVETIRFSRTISSRGDNLICDGLYVAGFAQKSHWGINALLGRRSYGLMRRSLVALLYFGLGLVRGVLAGCYQPLLPPGSSRRYLCESFRRCLGPYHDGLQVALACYFPCNIGLPRKGSGSAYREYPAKATSQHSEFSRLQPFRYVQDLSVC